MSLMGVSENFVDINTRMVLEKLGHRSKSVVAKPVVEYMPGWKCDISGVRRWEELPEAAQKYVAFIEEQIGCHIGFVSVGPERDSIIIR